MGERGESVLVVEDNDDTRYLLERILTMRGYVVHSEPDGMAALDWLRAGRRPASIVLDLYLPIMDGEAFLRELKADPRLSRIPVVAFTAHSGTMPDGLSACVRKGKDDPDVLLTALDACLCSADRRRRRRNLTHLM